MKATGIVRRIDELGRVVIPKEIRRTLRIREGDPLEIFTDRDGEVILKKYSPIGELSAIAAEYADALAQSLGWTVCISDMDAIVAAAGSGKKELMDRRVSEDVEQGILDRRTVLRNRSAGDDMLGILAQARDQGSYAAQLLAPIVSQGDAIGAVLLLSGEDKKLGDVEIKVAETTANLIARQLAQ